MTERPMNFVERITGKRRHLTSETCALTDTLKVRQWLAELDGQPDQQVFVFRPWGTLNVGGEKKGGASMLFSDGEHSAYAVPPGSGSKGALSSAEIESVMLEALTSSARPGWPDWLSLT